MFWAVFMCFSPYLGIGRGGAGGGGGGKGLVQNLLMQFFTRAAQNSKFPKLIFLTL